MKKLILGALVISFTFSGDLMADRWDLLNAEYQQRYDAMKADKKNTNKYTGRHWCFISMVGSYIEQAKDFDVSDAITLVLLKTEKSSRGEALARLLYPETKQDTKSEKLKALYAMEIVKLSEAQQEKSADPLLDIAEEYMKLFDSCEKTDPMTVDQMALGFFLTGKIEAYQDEINTGKIENSQTYVEDVKQDIKKLGSLVTVFPSLKNPLYLDGAEKKEYNAALDLLTEAEECLNKFAQGQTETEIALSFNILRFLQVTQQFWVGSVSKGAAL